MVGKFNGFLTVLLVVFPMSLDYLLGLRKIASVITDSLAQCSQAIFQVGHDCSIFGFIVLVDGLETILDQVVQFPSRRRTVASLVVGPVIIDELVFLGANADVPRVVMVGHVHPVAVICLLLPTTRFLAGLANRLEAVALHVAGRLNPGESEHGGSEVDVAHDGVGSTARLDRLGVAHEEGHPHGLVVHPSLVLVVVFAEHEALVPSIEDHGIVHQALSLQVCEKSLEVVVDPFHAT